MGIGRGRSGHPRAARERRNGVLTESAGAEPDTPAFERLSEITAPTTLFIGDRDHPVVIECATATATAIAARIRGCRRLTAPGADHMLPLRIPDVIAGHLPLGE